MVKMSSLLDTANMYLNKVKEITQSITAPNVNGNGSDQAKALSETSTKSALKDYDISGLDLHQTFLNEHSNKIENLSSQLVDDIIEYLTNMLDQELEGEIEIDL